MIASISYLLVVSVALGLAPRGLAGVQLPPPAQLVAAVRSGDAVEVERLARRLGSVRLETLAEHGSRTERLAALRAMVQVEDAWAVLPNLVRLLGDRDRDIAEAAALAARRVCEGLSPEVAAADEIPADVPERAALELGQVAGRADLSPAVRVSAVLALAALRTITHLDENEFQRLLGDPEPQVRRAASEALGDLPAARLALAQVVAKDASADVAAAAGAALCGGLPAVGQTAATTFAAALTPDTRARLRALAFDNQLSLADRLDLVACLRVGAQPADQEALNELAHRPPDSMRHRAKSLGGH